MLSGTAKREYMREYMRKRRAGEPTRKPEPEPTQRMIADVRHWFVLKLNRRRDLRGIGRKVVAGLTPYNADGSPIDAAWEEALQRYRTLRAEQRVERKRAKAERDAPPPPKCCSFCNEPASAKRELFCFFGTDADGVRHCLGPPFICEECTKCATAVFAK